MKSQSCKDVMSNIKNSLFYPISYHIEPSPHSDILTLKELGTACTYVVLVTLSATAQPNAFK